MTYADIEISINSANPVELYVFTTPDGVYRYTSHSHNVEYDDDTYVADIIQRTNIKISTQENGDKVTVLMDRDVPFAYQLLQGSVEGMITFEIFRTHDLIEFISYWRGEVKNAKLEMDSWEFEMRGELLDKGITQRVLQRLCALPLYGQGFAQCRVVADSYKVEGVLTAASGTVLEAAEFATKANDWFKGGKIKIGNAVRLIMSHTTTTITISSRIVSAEVGSSFTAYAGCDRTMEVCNTKFSNANNFGGVPYLHTKNPFTGDGML